MDRYFTASELAGLPGLPGTERGVQLHAERSGWRSRPRHARGGGREWYVRDLPRETRDALAARELQRQLDAQPSILPTLNAAAGVPSGAVIPLPVAAAASAGSGAAGALVAASSAVAAAFEAPRLADWQRQAMHARAGVIALVERLAPTAGGIDAAFEIVDRQLADGTADAATVRLFEQANVRRRGAAPAARIARSTLYRWRTAASAGGVEALAPDAGRPLLLPPWAKAALELWRQPAKPSLTFVAAKLPEALAPLGIEPPSYSQLRRFVGEKVGAIARNAGRLGPRELKTILPYVKRSTGHMWPGDVYTADGHTFDAEVAHPAHGRPFRPEITSVLDVATRKLVGFSLALDESGFAVLDAQRHAFTKHGVCAIWYVDRGSGYNNALQWDVDTGVAARLGFEIKHSLPYNSQARGLEERSHRTIWVEAARKLPTFVNRVMDAERKNKVFKLTRADVRKIGTSRLLMPWADVVPFLEAEVAAYNSRPHRGLPKARDAAGRLRHLSPDEAWSQALADGWKPHTIDAGEARDLFWPQMIRKVERGLVRIFGGAYYSAELAEYHGEPVRVCYDIHDASTVLIRDMAGRWLCDAVRDGNARDYFAESVIAQAAEKRAKARARRLQVKLDEVAEELAGPKVIEHAPSAAFEWTDLVPVHVAGGNTEPRGALEAIGSHKPELEGSIPSPATAYTGESAEHAADSRRDGDNSQQSTSARVAHQFADFARGETEETDDSVAQRPEVVRPVFAFLCDRYEWLMAPENRAAWTEQDRTFLRHYVAGDDYAACRERYEALGIAADAEDELFKVARAALPGRACL